MDHAETNLIVAKSNHGKRQLRQSQPRTILDEDEYTSTLTHIVTRDYFPSLPSLRRDAAILDARSRGDVSGAVAVRRAARKAEMEREREWEEEMEVEREAASSLGETALVPSRRQRGGDKDIVGVRKRPRPLKHESITGFHARVTSEDNAEFEKNQERERKEREEKLGVVYAARADKGGRLMIEQAYDNNNDGQADGDSTSKNNQIKRALCDTPLGLSSDLYDAPPSAGLRITDGKDDDESSGNPKRANPNKGIGRNGLFFQPQHHDSDNHATKNNASGKQLLLAAGPASSGTFLALENDAAISGTGGNDKEEESNAKSDNLLMPPPPARLTGGTSSTSIIPFQPSNDQSSTTNSKPFIDNRSQLVEYLPKPALPDIHPPATRFPYQNESRLLPNNTDGRSIVARNRDSFGSTMSNYTDASDTTDLDASPRPLDRERAAHQKARRREHETFVAMTPLIQPGGGGRGRGSNDRGDHAGGQTTDFEPDEPIMTWGDVASTPLVLGSGSAVDGKSTSVDWEPSRPDSSMSVGNDADSESSSIPAFDVVNESNREVMARRAERGLLDRAKTYRSAGKSKSRRKDTDDDSSVGSARSKSSNTPLDRTASLTPAARALLEASNKAHQSKKKSKLRSGIFQTSTSSSMSSSSTTRIHAGSRDSFGSALRMSYSASASSRDSSRKRKGSASVSSSAMRQAAGGVTPRCHARR